MQLATDSGNKTLLSIVLVVKVLCVSYSDVTAGVIHVTFGFPRIGDLRGGAVFIVYVCP